jgi:hypothetical protein
MQCPILPVLNEVSSILQKAKKVFLFICFTVTYISRAQNFGSSYDFLIKETNARVAALGGVNNSLRDDDVHLVAGNPAVVNGKMAKSLGLTVNPSLADIVQYNVAYADSIGKFGNVFATLQFLDYGKMNETDNTGFRLGEFQASQYASAIGFSQKKGNFHLGGALKFIGFQIQGAQSYAIAADLGVHYQHPVKQFSFGLALKNIGRTVKKFDTDEPMPLPFNLQASISYKLEHMPLRFSISGFYIQESDIQYLDPRIPGKLDINGKEEKPSKKLSEQIFRHTTIGGEFILHRSFNLRFGYNHLRRKELKTESGAGLTGFSLGFMINTKPINLSYTYAGLAGTSGNHFISLNCRFSQFITKE